jgi:site-specific DNA-methyltransferase (adenine-specific)
VEKRKQNGSVEFRCAKFGEDFKHVTAYRKSGPPEGCPYAEDHAGWSRPKEKDEAPEPAKAKPAPRVSSWRVEHGDCAEVMKGMADGSVDSIVTDPPYGLEFMGKDWDHGVPGDAFWKEALRVAKPGAHLLAFGGTRTFHRLACAIEDAGWEIRDCVMWVHGVGFPKSHNVGLVVDKMLGCPDRGHRIAVASRRHPDGTLEPDGEIIEPYEGKTEDGKRWQGFGTALKPAWEPIVVARKPMAGTIAENVIRHGVGGLNIDACRVGKEEVRSSGEVSEPWRMAEGRTDRQKPNPKTSSGRWPANFVHDGSPEVMRPFLVMGLSNSGSATRYFYCAKASRWDRDEGCDVAPKKQDESRKEGDPGGDNPRNRGAKERKNFHPTVKPTSLMRWLCRLVTPPGGVALDPFCGSGSTGKAAVLEGLDFIGIEKESEYVEIARKRIAHAANDKERS